jgi:hypothetical protein
MRTPTELVTFYIGTGESLTEFQVHKEVACDSSPVLKAAFNSTFVEGQTQTYRLEDTTANAFRHLVQWFYSKSMNFESHFENHVPRNSADWNSHQAPCRKKSRTLVDLWILADKLLIPEVQNLVIEEIIAAYRTGCLGSIAYQVNHVYENTEPGTALRRVIATLFSWRCDPEYGTLYLGIGTICHHPEFLADIAIIYMKAVPSRSKNNHFAAIKASDFFVVREAQDK